MQCVQFNNLHAVTHCVPAKVPSTLIAHRSENYFKPTLWQAVDIRISYFRILKPCKDKQSQNNDEADNDKCNLGDSLCK